MGFLRRLFGGTEATGPDQAAERDDEADDDGPEVSEPDLDPDAAERQHELDLLRGEQERHDELTQRQLRYARYAWQPPAQGGERRADDEESTQDKG
ncbi:MAG: hypothetical protein QOI10_4710 [Solirubrobacterales bacterium]|jgi:hypothetical protein|nr:hypothetical protein [Solirubrobacterales bacterium]